MRKTINWAQNIATLSERSTHWLYRKNFDLRHRIIQRELQGLILILKPLPFPGMLPSYYRLNIQFQPDLTII